MSFRESSNQGKAGAESKHPLSRILRWFKSTTKTNQTQVTKFTKQTKLCRVCENILREYELEVGEVSKTPFLFYLGPNVTVPHHQDLTSFKEAIATGCALCHRLLASAARKIYRLQEREPGFSRLGFAFQLQHIYWGEGMNMRWISGRQTSIFPQSEDGDDRNLAELYLREVNPAYHNPMEVSTNSETTFKQIHKWYHQCEKTHRNCTTPKDTPLPSRLIYIKNASIRLCESSNLPFPWSNERPRYATLSHCWGEIDFNLLLQSKLQHYLDEIQLDQLTKTFRDAITITRSLGLSFLWIDSLCIIQDSIEDWRKESALMADVYGGSAITIAAADAKNGSMGCFFQRSPMENNSLRLETALKVYLVDELMSQASAVQNSLLSKRGWAFQERFLSPRVLHFTRSQVFWKCTGGELASEAYPMGIPSSTYSYHETLTETMMRTPSVSKLRTWLDIVTRYSATDLTHYTDKLIALSGVTKWYQERYKLESEQYIAGVWKDQLWHDLLWMVNGAKKRDRPHEYQAPSWSWASQNEEVIFPIGSQIQFSSPNVSLASYHITYPDESVFGQVTGGYIRLRCTNLLLAPWTHNGTEDNFLIDLKVGSINCRITWDHEQDREKITYFLPLMEYKFQYRYKPTLSKRDRIKLQGIVLQTEGENIGTFRRVGYFDLMLSGRKTSTASELDPVMPPIPRAFITPGCIWRKVTARFRDLEETMGRRGYYIPGEEVYESHSLEEKDVEKFYEIIIV